MSRKWFSILALIAAATFLSSLSSCGFNQHLTSISIAPSGATFGAADPDLFVTFTATGTYDHPPETKDITNLVTWVSDTPQVAQVTGGVVSPSAGCGSANVYATYYDSPNQVTSNYANIVVDGPAADGCTPAGPQPILTVDFAGTGTGTVTGGINCSTPGSCSDQFPEGSTVVMTATATGTSLFGGWSGCTSTSPDGTVCTVLLENNLTVTATFTLP